MTSCQGSNPAASLHRRCLLDAGADIISTLDVEHRNSRRQHIAPMQVPSVCALQSHCVQPPPRWSAGHQHAVNGSGQTRLGPADRSTHCCDELAERSDLLLIHLKHTGAIAYGVLVAEEAIGDLSSSQSKDSGRLFVFVRQRACFNTLAEAALLHKLLQLQTCGHTCSYQKHPGEMLRVSS